MRTGPRGAGFLTSPRNRHILALVRQAKRNGKLIPASPDAPEVARCPACGAEVRLRKRRNGRGNYAYFYRHRAGEGEGCALRYRPTAD